MISREYIVHLLQAYSVIAGFGKLNIVNSALTQDEFIKSVFAALDMNVPTQQEAMNFLINAKIVKITQQKPEH